MDQPYHHPSPQKSNGLAVPSTPPHKYLMGQSLMSIFCASLGSYMTTDERRGRGGRAMIDRHTDVYGIGNADIWNTTMAFFVVWNGGSSVTAWVGK